MTEPTELGYGRVGRTMFLVVPAVIGALLGWGLVALLDWLLGLPWIPMRGPLTLLDSVPDAIALPALIGLGIVAGVLFGAYALQDELFVTVDDHEVRLKHGDADRRLPRTAVHAVFLDRKDLVLLGDDSNELAREKTDRPAAKLAEAFTRHGYPWRDADPRAGDFRLWTATAQGLPAGAGALLSMRARALKDDKNADAADLRAELINLGVVVRDEGGKQYWRRADRSVGS
jgi:hypothetical protein